MVDTGPKNGFASPPAGGAAPTLMQVVPQLVTGGVERGTVDVAAAAAEAGFRSIVVSSGGPMVRELTRAGVEHIEMPTDSKNLLVMRRNARRLADLIRTHGVDIVHVRSRAPAWSVWWATRKTGTPMVTTFHGTYNFGWPGKRHYNSIMTRGDRVIAISEFIADHIRRHYPEMNKSAIRVIPRGIDITRYDSDKVSPERVVRLSERWRLADGMPIIMLPGRLTRWKGQLLLVRALKELEGGPVRCLMVGDAQGRDAYSREIEEMARCLGVADMLHVVGDCDDMPAAYKLADVVVSASTDPEAFGRVAVEGQAMGRPVVAPRHGGAPEQVMDGETGWLFNPDDAFDLASKIDSALKLDAAARDALYQKAVANARTHYDKRRMCADTLNVYRELLGAPVEALPADIAEGAAGA